MLAQLDATEQGIAVADVDLEYLAQVRAKMPVLSHRRPDVYDKPVQVIKST